MNPTTAPHSPADEPPPGFDDFDLSDELLRGVDAAGYEVPTPVQVAAIPPMLEGHEVVVQANTGTGKTAAFGLPLLELLDAEAGPPEALVLTPTRELAQQVSNEIERLGKYTAVKAVAIYGGDSMERQVAQLRKGTQIVVGTPGRLLDHLRRRTLDPSRVRHLVLDEADEMLSMGFAKELSAILAKLPRSRKTCLFSATFPATVERIVARHVEDPVRVSLAEERAVAAAIEHHYYLASQQEKARYLVAVLDEEGVESGLVFCNRRDETRVVAKLLRRAGYHALPLNSDLSQRERDAVMNAIKRGELTVLVGTDIAARGIDISALSHVINYSVPESPEVYVHRTGRTGRVGRSGTAVTLVGAHELSSLKQVEAIKGIVLHERRLPPPETVMEKRVERLIADLKRVAKVRSPEQVARGDVEEFLTVAEQLKDDPEAGEVIYFLLQSFFEGLKPEASRAIADTELAPSAGAGRTGDRESRSGRPRRRRRRT